MRKLISIIMVAVLLFAGSILQKGQRTAATEQKAYWGSSAVQAGKYVYYKEGAITKTGAQLYRQKAGSSKAEKVTRVPGDFYVYDGYIYYLSGKELYKVKTDGTKKTQIAKDVLNIYFINGNYIYYKKLSEGSYKLYRIDLKGKNKKELSKIGYYSEAEVFNNKIYYVTGAPGKYKLNSTDLDGKNKKLILSAPRIVNLQLNGDKLCFVYNETTLIQNECIAQLTKSNEIQVVTKLTDGLDPGSVKDLYTGMSLKCIKDGVIYYTVDSDIEPASTLICKVAADGTRTVISSCSNTDLPNHTSMSGVGSILVEGDKLCVKINGDDANDDLYIMKTDGSDKKLILDYPSIGSVAFVGQTVYLLIRSNQDGDLNPMYKIINKI